jgi:predicted nucleic acid-binding protein
MKGIADTGLVVALLNRDDRHHQWALEIARGVSEPLLTCESVLSESGYQVGSIQWVLGLVQGGFLKIAFDLSENFEQIRELVDQYADRKPDLADLCLVRMSELFPSLPVLTVDETDFRVYRRNKREAIPLICPPRS